MKRLSRWLLAGLSVVAGSALVSGDAVAGAIRSVTTGKGVTCAITANLQLWCWGRNDRGQLGDGTTTRRLWPKQVSGARLAVSRDDNTCAIPFDGSVRCTGANDRGQLGDGSNVDRHVFGRVGTGSGGGNNEAVTAGAVACKADFAVNCWGSNQFGGVGDGSGIDQRLPVSVNPPLQQARALDFSGGDGHTCAVKPLSPTSLEGELWCWGNDPHGALGGDPAAGWQSPFPVPIAAFGSDVGNFEGLIGVGPRHTCVVKSDNTLWCVGRNDHGQLGDGTTTHRSTPIQVTALSNQVRGVSVSPGGGFTCASTVNGVFCWGQNDRGQLGDGTTTERHLPVAIAVPVQMQEVSAGNDHACAYAADGLAGRYYCWGANDDGQLGDNTWIERHTPVRVFLTAAPPAPVPSSDLAGGLLLALALAITGWWSVRVRTPRPLPVHEQPGAWGALALDEPGARGGGQQRPVDPFGMG